MPRNWYIDHFQSLVCVSVHDDGHAGDEHEDGRDWYAAIVSLAQHHEGLPSGLAICLLGSTCSSGGPRSCIPRRIRFSSRCSHGFHACQGVLHLQTDPASEFEDMLFRGRRLARRRYFDQRAPSEALDGWRK